MDNEKNSEVSMKPTMRSVLHNSSLCRKASDFLCGTLKQ